MAVGLQAVLVRIDREGIDFPERVVRRARVRLEAVGEREIPAVRRVRMHPQAVLARETHDRG